MKLYLPVDYITADSFSATAKTGYATDETGIPDGWLGLDCGEKSNKIFTEVILSAKTILWNGPAGVFEFDAFANGTKAAMDAVVEATDKVMARCSSISAVPGFFCDDEYSSTP